MSANVADNSLHWLKGELDLTIGRVQSCLEAYLEDSDEHVELLAAAGHIDQLRGALTMLDLPDGIALAEEMCRTVRALCDSEIEDAEGASNGLMRAALRFPGYLKALAQLGAASAPDIKAITRELRGLRKGTQPTSEASEPVSLDAFNRRLTREIRPAFQKALVGLMRGHEVAQQYQHLAGTLRNLASLAATEDDYRVWWYVGRLVEGLERGAVSLSPDKLRLLGATDRAIKALIDRGRSFSKGPEVEAIPQQVESMLTGTEAANLLSDRHDYDPPVEDSPFDQVPGLDHETLTQIATLLRETLALAQDGIDRLARGDETGGLLVPGIVDRLESAVGVLTMVNLDVIASMVREQKETLAQCVAQETTPTAPQLELLAEKLVLIEDGLNVIAQPLTAQRAMTGTQQSDDTDASRAPESVEGSRHALARFEVVREALGDIAQVRELATKCCWDESGRESWSVLSPVLHRLANVLTVLELNPGAETVVRVERIVADPRLKSLAIGDSPATNALAEALVGIEYYIEGEIDVGQPRQQGLEHATKRLQRLESLLTDSTDSSSVTSSVGAQPQSDVAEASVIPVETQLESFSTDDTQSLTEDLDFLDSSDGAEPEIVDLERMDATDVVPLQATIAADPNVSDVTGSDDLGFDSLEPDVGKASDADDRVPDADLGELLIPANFVDEPVLDGLAADGAPVEHGFDGTPAAEVDEGGDYQSGPTRSEESPGDEAIDSGEFAPLAAQTDGCLPDADRSEPLLLEDHVEGSISENVEEQETTQVVASFGDALIELGFDAASSPARADDCDAASDLSGIEISPVEAVAPEVLEAVDLREASSTELAKQSPDDVVEPVDLIAPDELFVDCDDSVPVGSSDDAGSANDVSDPSRGDLDSEPVDGQLQTGETERSDSDTVVEPPPWATHEFLDVFLEEADGVLDELMGALPLWEQDPADPEILAPIRRAFHTLKGSGRMVGAEKAGEFACALEDVTNRVQGNRLAPSTGLIDLVREATDVMAELVRRMESGDDAVDIEPTLARIKRHVEGDVDSNDDAPTPESMSSETDSAADPETSASPADQTSSLLESPIDPDGLRERALGLLEQIESFLGASQNQENSLDALESVAQSFQMLGRTTVEAGMDDLAELCNAVDPLLLAHLSDERPLGLPALEILSEAVAECYRRLDDLRRPAGYVSRAPEVLRRLHQLAERVVSDESACQPGASAQIAVDTSLDPELVEVFVQEAGDILDSTDVTLDRWGREPSNFDLLTDLRREMHTLKGSSRMAGFMVIGDLAHAMESLLDEISRGSRSLTAHGRGLLQKALDRLHTMLEASRVARQPDAADDLVAELQRCAAGEEMASESAHEAPSVEPADDLQEPPRPGESEHSSAGPAADGLEQMRSTAADSVMLVSDSSDMVRVSSELLDRLGDQMGESSIYRARIEQGVNSLSFNLGEMEQTVARLSEKLRRLEIETETQILFRYERGGASDFEEEFDPLELDRFSELQQLSRSLMEVVSDLTSIHTSLDDQAQELDTLLQQQGKVNREIQEGLMRTRMVRFDSIVPRMRRVVRQVADELDKRAELVLEGGGEMERSLLDHVVAPLEHLLRNCVSHGIEDPASRMEAEKPEFGNIHLGVRREGSELVVEVSDDGAGIDFEKVRGKAERLGMIAVGQEVSRDDLINCLLQPGFSTANQVTQVAGRGVGMDIVHNAVAGFGGSLAIQSERGVGTRILIRMPFSLSLAQALIVKASGETYAVPLAGIEAMTRLDPEMVQNYLEKGRGSVEYSGVQYDIHSLGALFGGAPPDGELLERHLPAILARGEDVSVALQVDQVIGSQEVIVKPVGTQVSSVPGISGATIAADGSVVLILELGALVRNFVARRSDAEALVSHESRQEAEDTILQIMVVDDSITMRKVTSRLVERHGMQSTVAKDGLDAAALLEDSVPDAVVLDIEMPRMDGFELAAHIRNQEHLWHLPIIMVTSRSGDKHRQRAMDLGVNAYLGKPYREEELLSALRQVLGPRGERIAI